MMLFLLKFITLSAIIAKYMGAIAVSWWVALIPLYLLIAIYVCTIIFMWWYVSNHPDKHIAINNINELKKVSLDNKLSKEQKTQLTYTILAIGFPEDKMKILRKGK